MDTPSVLLVAYGVSEDWVPGEDATGHARLAPSENFFFS